MLGTLEEALVALDTFHHHPEVEAEEVLIEAQESLGAEAPDAWSTAVAAAGGIATHASAGNCHPIRDELPDQSNSAMDMSTWGTRFILCSPPWT